MQLTFGNIIKKVLDNDRLSYVEKEKLLKGFIKEHTGKNKPETEKYRVMLQGLRVYKRGLVLHMMYEKHKRKLKVK